MDTLDPAQTENELFFGIKNPKKKNKNVLLQRMKEFRHTQNRGNLAITLLDIEV